MIQGLGISATSTDPNVQYAHEDGIASNEAKYVRQASVTYPGPSARRAVYYNYPASGVGAALGRLDNIASVQNTNTASEKFVAYSYFGASTVLKVAYPAVTSGGSSLALTYGASANPGAPGLDRFGRVVDQKWQIQSGTPVVKDQFKYAYDRTSNRTSRDVAPDAGTPPTGLDHYYTYDGLDRLTQSNRGNLASGVITDQNADANQAWGLDTVGNWTQFKWDADGGGAGTPTVQSRAHNKANEIAGNGGNPISGSGAANWVDPTYDQAGNMISGPQPRYETVDANTQLYKYDAWNRLTKIYRDANCNDTIDDPSELVVTYSYDGQNRRIRKVVAGNDTYDYYYNESWQVLEVCKASRTNKTYQQYVWGIQYIDAPVVQFRDTADDGTLDQALYYTYDGNFNVTALVGTNGTVAERYTYDPYGKVTFKAADWSDAVNQAKSAYDNEILYCGYRFDPESGLFHVRNRYLTPPLGRWLTNDLIGYRDGMNRYQYGKANPLSWVDTHGTTVISVGSLAVFEFHMRYLFSSEWLWTGDVAVNSKLDVTKDAVTYLNTNVDASPTQYWKRSYTWSGQYHYFGGSGYGKKVQCPCYDAAGKKISDSGWEGVYVYHLHVVNIDAAAKIEKVTVGAKGSVGKKDVAGVEAGVSIDIRIENPNELSKQWYEATICPDGKGGIIISDKDGNATTTALFRIGEESSGIDEGNEKARGH